MKDNDRNYFKEKLIDKRKEVETRLKSMKEGSLQSKETGIFSELSHYDNHPSDEASELYQIENEISLQNNQSSILDKINDGLERIENGKYGTCSHCGDVISRRRLDVIPYTNLCAKCAKEESEIIMRLNNNNNNKGPEERTIGIPFNFENKKDINGFDGEDTLQKLEAFNSIKDGEEFDEEEIYVEDIDKISNTQYKNTLQ